MKLENTAHFNQIREQNRKIIRNLIGKIPGVGKTELADLSGLTFPTVSSVLKDLVASGEVIELDGISKGGRPGAIFELNESFQFIVCAYIADMVLHIRIFDACGKQCEQQQKTLFSSIECMQFIDIFKEIKEKYSKISVISLGIPGVVLDGVIKHLPGIPTLDEINIKKCLEEALDVTVFVENDTNTIVLAEKNKYKDIAHIIINHCGIGTGILLNGQLIRGAHGCAGELEYIFDEKAESLEVLTQAITAITCVIDIADISISGITLDESMLSNLREKLMKRLPHDRIPEIHVISSNDLYYQGLYNIAFEYCKSC